MSYKLTDRTSLKGVPHIENGEVFVHILDGDEVLPFSEIVERYLEKEVRLTISFEEKPLDD